MGRHAPEDAENRQDDPALSIYDAGPQEEPWFVPPPPDVSDTAWDMPGPRAARPGPAVSDWLAAEAGQGRALARAAAAFARLDERVAAGPAGLVRRLALTEASAISWAAGGRVAEDRLALHDLDRADMARDDAGALAAAHWALRRLEGGPGPEAPGFPGGDGLAEDPAWLRWQAGQGALAEALPLVRAAAAFPLWRAEGLGADVLEPAVIAARIGGAGGRTLPFLPLARSAAPYTVGGSADDRLASWARAAETGALRALMDLDRLAAWATRAREATAAMSGRTPGLLIDALLASPALSAGMAARLTGASRPGIRRNIARLAEAGMVQEITGQGRFRFWRAAV